MSTTGKVRERERVEAVRLKAAGGGVTVRCCAWPGCEAEGTYRAPLSREHLREYQFLCLEHVREFNRRWDYFSGMNRDQIERHQKADTTWHRPTWHFGTMPGDAPGGEGWGDPFGLFEEERRARRRQAPPPRPLTKAQRMMAVLDLDDGFTFDELRARYKALAKKHHPDLNGGDKASEERLKLVIEAYTYLKDERLYV
ncbi:MAG TPA: J domain-containing protein [Geminicoccaceae bacterium]